MQLLILSLSLASVIACKSLRTKSNNPEPANQEASDAPQTQDAQSSESALPNAEATYVATPVPAGTILKKVVGALSKEDPKSQHYECTVAEGDLSNLDQVKQWIATVEKAPIVEALHFRATIPSIQIFAYQNGQEVLLFESYSKARYRQPASDNEIKNSSAEELMKIANQKCPYP